MYAGHQKGKSTSFSEYPKKVNRKCYRCVLVIDLYPPDNNTGIFYLNAFKDSVGYNVHLSSLIRVCNIKIQRGAQRYSCARRVEECSPY